MPACKLLFSSGTKGVVLIALLAMIGGCSPRTLVLVERCAEGAGGCPGQPDSGTLRNGLVGLWHFDEAASGVTAVDSSGNANDGTLMGPDPSAAWTMGRIGNGLYTNAVRYTSVPASASIDSIVSQVTVAAWVYLEGTIVEYATAASRQVGNTIDQHYHISLNSVGWPSFWLHRSLPNSFPVQVLARDVVVPPMEWTHIAGVYDGFTAFLYVDGTEVASKPMSGTFGPETNPLILGANGNKDLIDERFPGRIDEIVLYKRALSADEVRQLAAGANP